MFSISRIKHTFSLNLFAIKATIGDLKILQLRSLKITLSFLTWLPMQVEVGRC